MNDELNKADDPIIDQMLERLLDGHSIDVNNNNKANRVVSQLQQLMHSFIPHEHDFNGQDLVGKKWGDMQVQEVIGEGGMGVVYLAHDAVLDRLVALKVLNGFALNYMDSKSFVNEAKLMAQVRHPHIMAVFGAAIHDDIAGYWGELLNGQTVEQYLQEKGGLDDRELSDLCIQLAEAVRAIHGKGLVHGDIKSNNVVIESGRGAVLMDFGTSFDLNDAASAWFRPSTPLAMAPEQFKGEKQSQASDIFSLGVLFHLLVTGEYPYAGETFEALKTAVLANNRRSFNNPHHHKAYEKLIDRMLCPAPEDSPSIGAVLGELQKIRQIPLQQAKNRLFAFAASALLIITIGSLYLAYNIKQSAQKILQANHEIKVANQDSETLNSILTEIIEAPSFVQAGKDVLVKDLVAIKAAEIKNNPNINPVMRNRIYLSLAHSLATLGERGQQLELLQAIADSPDQSSQYHKKGLINLALVKIRDQQFDQVEPLLLQAQTIAVKDPATRHKLDIILNDAYADYYRETTQFEKALQHSAKSIELWEHSTLDFDAAISYFRYGQDLLTLSQFDAAKSAYQRSMELTAQFRDEENYYIFIAQMDLAIIAAQTGQFDEAIELYQQLLPAAEKFLDSQHTELFGIKMNYAFILSMAGENIEALNLLQSLLHQSSEADIDRRATIYLKPGIAEIYHNIKDYQHAEIYYLQAIAEAIEFFSANHESIMTLYSNLATLYMETDRAAKALELINQQLPASLELYGAEHINNIEMSEVKAWSLFLLRKPELALPLIDSVLERRIKIYGQQHEDTQLAIQRKAQIVQQLSLSQ